MAAWRATLVPPPKSGILAIEIDGALWDRLRDLQHKLGQSPESMFSWLTDGGTISPSEEQIEKFVKALEEGRPYP